MMLIVPHNKMKVAKVLLLQKRTLSLVVIEMIKTEQQLIFTVMAPVDMYSMILIMVTPMILLSGRKKGSMVTDICNIN